MKKYKAVLWDMDGTLLDTAPGIYKATDLMLERLGLTYPTDFDKANLIGPPMQEFFVNFLGMDTAKALDTANLWRDIYKDTVCEAQPYTGIAKLLNKLHEQNIKQAVATNKTQDNAERILVHFGFDKVLDSIKGGSRSGKLNKTDLIRLCLEELQIDCSNAILVGDSTHDAEGAAANGVDFIAVTYGYGFRSKKDVETYKHISCAVNVMELEEILTCKV